jgi:hypothetical protein
VSLVSSSEPANGSLASAIYSDGVDSWYGSVKDDSCSLMAGGCILAADALLEAVSLGVFSRSEASDAVREDLGADLPPNDLVSADISMICPATGGDAALLP